MCVQSSCLNSLSISARFICQFARRCSISESSRCVQSFHWWLGSRTRMHRERRPWLSGRGVDWTSSGSCWPVPVLTWVRLQHTHTNTHTPPGSLPITFTVSFVPQRSFGSTAGREFPERFDQSRGGFSLWVCSCRLSSTSWFQPTSGVKAEIRTNNYYYIITLFLIKWANMLLAGVACSITFTVFFSSFLFLLVFYLKLFYFSCSD